MDELFEKLSYLDDDDSISKRKRSTIDQIDGERKTKRYKYLPDTEEYQSKSLIEPLMFDKEEEKELPPFPGESLDRHELDFDDLEFDIPIERNSSEPEFHVQYRRVLKHLPDVPHVTVGTYDGSRLYLRIFPEMIYEDDIHYNHDHNATPGSLLGIDLNKARREDLLKRDAEVVRKKTETENTSDSEECLWVEKYKPNTYMQLLSEEDLNRTLLHWLKLWDKIVFGNDYLVKFLETKEKYTKQGEIDKEKEWGKKVIVEDDAYDDTNRPKQKVALLHGPPGLGKTTCAHIIAKHAGYNVVEMNASDDRSVEAFKNALDSSTQSRAETFRGRPNCLIIDEIDGAPLNAVNVLVELITGKATESGKNKNKKILRRPVICICNDLYAPSLKNLKQLAFVLQFQPLTVESIIERMEDISLKEEMNLDSVTLRLLCEKAQCDIRSCLFSLQFLKKSKTNFRDAVVAQIGNTDKSKGIFTVWNEIFSIPNDQNSRYSNSPDQSTDVARFNNILKTVQNFGDYEKLADGIFQNYLSTKFKDSYFQSVLEGLDWMTWFEAIRGFVVKNQNYSLYGYLPFYFVVIHFLYANRTWFKIKYPNIEIISKSTRYQNILKTQMVELIPSVGRFITPVGLVLDVLPLLISIIQPQTIRPVASQLWSIRERETMKSIIEIMIAYNLCYTQQKTDDGAYNFILEPNFEEIVNFTLQDALKAKQFAYSVKQVISREIEQEKIRRNEGVGDEIVLKKIKGQTKNVNEWAKTSQAEKKIVIKEEQIAPKDFFGRTIIKDPIKMKSINDAKNKEASEIYFRFKEGYSNAVRHNLKLKDFI